MYLGYLSYFLVAIVTFTIGIIIRGVFNVPSTQRHLMFVSWIVFILLTIIVWFDVPSSISLHFYSFAIGLGLFFLYSVVRIRS